MIKKQMPRRERIIRPHPKFGDVSNNVLFLKIHNEDLFLAKYLGKCLLCFNFMTFARNKWPSGEGCGCVKILEKEKNRENRIGKTEGRLTVVYEIRSKELGDILGCECWCGNRLEIPRSRWRSIFHCGCLKREIAKIKKELDGL